MKHTKLKYGIRDGELVHISQVESGLACSCQCANCNEILVAKRGLKRDNHFAHKSGDTCKYATETALHLAAKEILNKHKEIRLPSAWIKFNTNRSGYQIASEKTVSIDSLKIERGIDGIIPDLIATVGGRELLIEVFVTHPVSDIKKEKIEDINRSTIEIDLSKAPRDMHLEALTDLIINNVDNKKWIYNVRSKIELNRMLSQARCMPITVRGFASHIDYCPIKARVWRGKPYANLIDDCIYCEHCLDIQSEDHIYCNGHISSQNIYQPRKCM